MSNKQLGYNFTISYSVVSHRVRIFNKKKMINDKKMKNQFDKINSQFIDTFYTSYKFYKT